MRLTFIVLCVGITCVSNQGRAQDPAFGFNPLWSRNGQAVIVSGDAAAFVTGSTNALVLENRGPEDWALETASSLHPQVGEVWEFSVTVDFQGAGGVVAAFAWRNEQGVVLDWTAGQARAETPGRHELRARWMVTEPHQTLTPRIIGWGEQDVRLESPRLQCLRTLPPGDFVGRDTECYWNAGNGLLTMGVGGGP